MSNSYNYSELVHASRKIRGLKSNEYKASGKYPIVDQGNNFIAGYSDNEDALYRDSLPVIVFGDHTLSLKYVDFPFCVGADGTQIIKPKTDLINPRFMLYAIMHRNIKSLGYSRHFKVLKETIFNVPSLSEQERIVKILDEADSLRNKRKEAIKLLDDFLVAKFFDMFGDPLDNPNGWNTKRLGEISSVKIGPFGSLLHKSDYIENGIPLVNPKHMINNRITADPNNSISPEKLNELNAYLLKEGDIILARRGEIGRCALVTKDEDGYLCGTGSMFVRPQANLKAIFLIYLITTPQITSLLHNLAKGITMKNLNADSLKELKIPVPPIESQDKFEAIYADVQKLKLNMLRQSDQLDNQFNALMQTAFTA